MHRIMEEIDFPEDEEGAEEGTEAEVAPEEEEGAEEGPEPEGDDEGPEGPPRVEKKAVTKRRPKGRK